MSEKSIWSTNVKNILGVINPLKFKEGYTLKPISERDGIACMGLLQVQNAWVPAPTEEAGDGWGPVLVEEHSTLWKVQLEQQLEEMHREFTLLHAYAVVLKKTVRMVYLLFV